MKKIFSILFICLFVISSAFCAGEKLSIKVDVNSTGDISSGGILSGETSFYLNEQAAALIDYAGAGQLWIKNTVPCEIWFTDDTGTDTQLGAGGSGTVTASDTPLINQLAVWTTATNIRGFAGLSFDGTDLTTTGIANVKSVNLENDETIDNSVDGTIGLTAGIVDISGGDLEIDATKKVIFNGGAGDKDTYIIQETDTNGKMQFYRNGVLYMEFE